MKILALEFSSDDRSVAVVERRPEGTPVRRSAVSQKEGRETQAIALMEQALAQAGVDRSEIECIAIGLGPGSYTGIRLSIALAQGWQLAREVRIFGIGSMDIMAIQIQENGHPGTIHLVVDAQRGEFYTASYDLADRPPRLVRPLRIIGQEELKALSREPGLVAGPEIERWFQGGLRLTPDAAALGSIAAIRWNTTPHQDMEPIYLRATSFVKAPPPRFVP
jgi:tRNA threonylcarbamoyl adenosine modification protein YeaZ